MDGRKINRKKLEKIRIDAVLRIIDGESPEKVISEIGFTRSLVYEWLKKYRHGGLSSLKVRKASGRVPKLDDFQLRNLYRTIVKRQRFDDKKEYPLWTRSIIQQLIKEEFEINLSNVAVGHQLEKIGLSHEKTSNANIIDYESEAAHWYAGKYSMIRKQANVKKAKVWFVSISVNWTKYHSDWFKVPFDTQISKKTAPNLNVKLLSAINPSGAIKFMATDDQVTVNVLIDFVERLIYESAGPLFLIVENKMPYRHRDFLEFIATQKGRLWIFYLPSHFPPREQDEHIWNYIKVLECKTKAGVY